METHKIEGTDDLLMSTIKDQAADLEHGWREAIQNGIDSPGSDRVELEWNADYSVIRDNGDGVDLTAEDGIDLLTNLGESSKSSDDDSTIGEFGIGKGQIIAKGKTVMKSGEKCLIFDIENWGLEVREDDLDDPVDGLVVEINHYDDEVPDEGSYKWDGYEERIQDRFKYVEEACGVEVVVNGETISDHEPSEAVEGAAYNHIETLDDDTHIAVKHGVNGGLSVYSRGVYVKDVESRGLNGVIVTERNLSLNFARNDIKSGCSLWSTISDRLSEIRTEMFEEIPDNRLNSEARAHLADEMFRDLESGDDSTFEEFKDRSVLRTTNDSYVSPSEVLEKNQISYAEPGDKAADTLIEAYGMTVLDETDKSVQRFQKAAEELDAPEVFEVREKAEENNLFTGHEKLDESELQPKQRKKLAVARELADRMGIDREIHYGESDVAAAWTDGYNEIVITDGATPSSNRLAWMPELFETLIHEYAHDNSTKEGCPSHGRFFDEKYREYMEELWPEFSAFIEEAARSSVKDLVGE